MKATIYISGIIGKDTTLVDVIRQFKAYEEPTEVEAKIHSEGGDVDEGNGIFDYLNGLKSEIPVNTYATKAYSISAKIFSVGQERIVEDVEKALMIHFAWAKTQGKAEKLEAVAEYLRGLEDDFSAYYSEFLDVDEDTARNLLDNETFISGTEAVELGFATEVKEVTEAVAQYNFIDNSKDKKMKKSFGQRLKAAIAQFLEDENVGEEVNALTLQDSNSTEIEFPDLEDGATPTVGDSAMIDGSVIPDGEHIMPSLDEATIVFEDGKVKEIKPKEEEETTEEDEVKAEEVQQISVWTQEASNTSFEIGDQMTYEYDGEVYNYGAGEYYVPSIGKNVVTDASGVIVAHKDATVVVEASETTEETDPEMTEEEVNGMVQVLAEGIEAKISAKYDKKLSAFAKKMGSKDFDVNAIETETVEGEEKLTGAAKVFADRQKVLAQRGANKKK